MDANAVNMQLDVKQEVLVGSLPPPLPPPPTHHHMNLVDAKDNHNNNINSRGGLCSDPEIEETIRRLTLNLKNVSDRLIKDEQRPPPVGENINHQIMSKPPITTNVPTPNPGIPMHEAFVLSIEELDNHSVDDIMLQGKSPKKQQQQQQQQQQHQQQRHIYESPEARARRLARNAERMRQRRNNESEEEYRIRLFKMAEASRRRRRNENEIERAMRLVRDAARQRLRRALESPDKRSDRLAKLAKRAREVRLNESPEQRSERLRKLAEHHRNKYARQRQHKKDEIKQEIVQFPSSANTTNTYPDNMNHGVQIAVKQQNILPTNLSFSSQHANATTNSRLTDFVQSPSSSSSGSSDLSQPYQQLNASYPQYQLFRANHFPELPPHLTPNRTNEIIPSQWIPNQFPELSQTFSHSSLDPKYYQKIQQALSPNSPPPPQPPQQQPQLPPPPPPPPGPNNPSSISAIPTTTLTVLTPPSTPQFYHRPQMLYQQLWPSSAAQPPPSSSNQETAFLRGRPIKILPSNDYRTINPEQRDEADRQQRMNDMLEAQITQMLTSPKQHRGRPNRGRETDPEREERLRKMAEARRLQRQRESPDERATRLKDLAERARKRREAILATESPDERKSRLQKQAEYARQRRIKAQTPEAIKMAEQKAKYLYTTLHDDDEKQQKENGKY